MHQLGDARAPAGLVRFDRVARPQEAIGGLADIDEGGVHRRIQAAHPAQIDAAEDGRIAVAEMVDLPHLLAVQQGGAHLAGKALDQQGCAAHRVKYPKPASRAETAATSRPTTLVYEPLIAGTKAAAWPWMA